MVLDLAATHFCTVRGPEQRYLCIKRDNQLTVIRDACKHKGGPLSKGTWNEKTGSITCPWHEIVNTARDLSRNLVPSVRVGSTISIVVPDA